MVTHAIAKTQEKYVVFKSTKPMNTFIFPNGRYARFVNGRFLTNVVDEIEQLKEEIEVHHNPFFYLDPEEEFADPKLEDPMEALRAKIIKEYLEKEAAATNPKNDAGNYSPGKLTPTSSMDVAATSQGGSGASLAQRILQSVKGE
jgi:hypothetical protein